MDNFLSRSPLEEELLREKPILPHQLRMLKNVSLVEDKNSVFKRNEEIKKYFPHTFDQPILKIEPEGNGTSTARVRPLKIGVVLSGGQAPGGHNVIAGLFDSMKALHPESTLIGFLGGPSGIIEGKHKEITEELLKNYRNTGGFDLIGSGRTKIETSEQLEASVWTMQALNLDGLVIIGGDDSNTNAAFLAEYFLIKGCATKVIGVPKTIDGDLKNTFIEVSFGFDTACKVYSALIGNIARDALSAKKYYHFIKLMGRSASHIALECALEIHPNMTIIGEEVASQKKTLEEITEEIADLVCKRAELGKNYGIILIPEGAIEFIPEMHQLIKELNSLLAKDVSEDIISHLSPSARHAFDFLPKEISQQLLLDRDPHGNVQVSHISTEQLFIYKVKEALKKRSDYKGKFNAIPHFFGYEGRAAFPSYFDTHYCYTLGHMASLLVHFGKTGYMSVIQNLSQPVEEWKGGGIPLTLLMAMEERKGKQKAVIQKALVELRGEPFKAFASCREKWKVEDHYRFPGPIQYFGPEKVVKSTPMTLQLEQGAPLVSL